MRRLFDDELNELDANFTELGMMVSDAIDKAVTAFVNHDRELAESIIKDDHAINEREMKLEKKSFELIALYQPVTTDLREIVTILKAVSDLERMGDYARDIAQYAIRAKGNKRASFIEEDISTMGDMVKTMIEAVLSAYVKDDAKRAREVADTNKAIGDIYTKIYQEAIDTMKQDPEIVFGTTNYLSAASALERICDYATNICEWIVYLNTGKIVELSPTNVNF